MSIAKLEQFESYSPDEYDPSKISPEGRKLCGKTQLEIKGKIIPFYETTDFPLTDPWSSKAFRPFLRKLMDDGWLRGQKGLEFGVGDGRNLEEILNEVSEVIGVDLDPWRLQVCAANLQRDAKVPFTLFQGDAVEFIRKFGDEMGCNAPKGEKFQGRVMMCLPQSRGGGSTADVIRPHKFHKPYARWREWGMDLNAAALGELRRIVTDDTEALVILNDRIPAWVREKMIDQMGWKIKIAKRVENVQQDPDTNLDWMLKLRGRLENDAFRDENGISKSIDEAVERIHQAGGKRENLNLYHDVYLYVLQPNSGKICDRAKYGRERPTTERMNAPKALPIFNLPFYAGEFSFLPGVAGRLYDHGLPFLEGSERIVFPDEVDVASVTGAGEFLDWLAAAEFYRPKIVRTADFFDINPSQNFLIAHLLSVLTLSANKDDFIHRLKDLKPENLNKSWWDFVINNFPELEQYHPETAKEEDKVIDWDYLNKFVQIVESGKAIENKTDIDDHLTEKSLGYYFLKHDGLFAALKKMVASGRIHFYESALEDVQHPDSSHYHVIYGSDIHTRTDGGDLYKAYERLLVNGGYLLMATSGKEKVGDDEEIFFRLFEGNFTILPQEIFSNQNLGMEKVLDILGISNDRDSREAFLQAGMLGLPDTFEKQPKLLRRRRVVS